MHSQARVSFEFYDLTTKFKIDKINFIFSQTEFKYFWIHELFEKSFRTQDLTNEFGKNSTFLFHFLGYGDILIMDKRKIIHS